MPLFAHADALLFTVALAETIAGAVIVILAVPVQPVLSVTVTVYVPAESPVALALVLPPGFQEYV